MKTNLERIKEVLNLDCKLSPFLNVRILLKYKNVEAKKTLFPKL